jgi:hypothetical protein
VSCYLTGEAVEVVLATGETRHFKAGSYAFDIALTPNGKRLFVSNAATDFNPDSGGDTVYSTRSNKTKGVRREMSKEVREAAQKILSEMNNLIEANHASRFDLKIKLLAEAWLAEHPEDDDEEPSEEWLEKVGFKEDDTDTGKFMWINNHKSGNKFDLQYWYEVDCWMIADADNEIEVYLATRGDVRRLARALLVELGEQR